LANRGRGGRRITLIHVWMLRIARVRRCCVMGWTRVLLLAGGAFADQPKRRSGSPATA
jgi:hypothetical protein